MFSMRLHMGLRYSALLCSAALLHITCSTTSIQRTAETGTYDAFCKALSERANIDRSELRSLALTIAQRELGQFKTSVGRQQVDAARHCYAPLARSISDRAAGQDAAASAASVLLLEKKALDPEALIAKYQSSRQAHWRAVAARAAWGPDHGPLRRILLTDMSKNVRRRALQASLVAKDPLDVPQLIEAAHHDPEPTLQSLAIRVLGKIGGSTLSLTFRDWWDAADEAIHLALVDAWSQAPTRDHGGQEQLKRLLELPLSLPTIAASQRLLDTTGNAGNEATQRAENYLVGALRQKDLSAQLLDFAASGAPLKPPYIELLHTLTQHDNPRVSARAWARLLHSPKHRLKATKALVRTLGADDAARRIAIPALLAIKDASVIPHFRALLRDATVPSNRSQAAIALLQLGQLRDTALTLSDPDPVARFVTACAILGEPGSSDDSS